MGRPVAEAGGGPFRVDPFGALFLGFDMDEVLLGVDFETERFGAFPPSGVDVADLMGSTG